MKICGQRQGQVDGLALAHAADYPTPASLGEARRPGRVELSLLYLYKNREMFVFEADIAR